MLLCPSDKKSAALGDGAFAVAEMADGSWLMAKHWG
jgi:hypothetical protein